MGWAAAAAIGGQILDSWISSSSAHKANRTNIKLAREQRAWEQEMSNTSVQRRADDVEKAGFNRLLAATGPGASTPSVSAPTVEPTYRGEFTRGGGAAAALVQAEQLRNLRANTELTTAKAGQEKEVLANMERPGPSGRNRYQAQQDIKDLHARLKFDTDQIRQDMTAAQLRQFTEATDAVVSAVKTQAERGKIELDQLKSLIESFGLGAQAKATLMKSLMQIIMPLWGTGK